MTYQNGVIENGIRAGQRFHWVFEERNNLRLQVFFAVNDWTDYTEETKRDWLRFATRGPIVSTTILSMGEDTCEWTVVKQYVPGSNLEAVAVRRIHIPGLTEFLLTADRLP